MKDRIPVNIAPNGAIKYGVYDAAGVLQRYEYIKLEDGATELGTPINKTTLLKDTTAALYGLGVAATPDDVFVANNAFVKAKVKALQDYLYIHRVSTFQKMMMGGFQ